MNFTSKDRTLVKKLLGGYFELIFYSSHVKLSYISTFYAFTH